MATEAVNLMRVSRDREQGFRGIVNLIDAVLPSCCRRREAEIARLEMSCAL